MKKLTLVFCVDFVFVIVAVVMVMMLMMMVRVMVMVMMMMMVMLLIHRGSTDSGIRSDDQLELQVLFLFSFKPNLATLSVSHLNIFQDISDCESSMLPSFSSMHSSRLQSRLNPV